LHENWHVVPAAMLLVHVPSTPLVGAVTAHGAYVGANVGDWLTKGVPEIMSMKLDPGPP
jgi:hypothetical protein